MTGYEGDRVTDEQVLRVTGGQGMTGYEEDRVTDEQVLGVTEG